MNYSMTVRFWGVRGSIPSPGASTVRYGGNTSCVSIDPGADKLLILDSGTGIREMGKTITERNAELYILLSHNHWDHIQGFPFFSPIYQSDQKIYLLPHVCSKDLFYSLVEQMDGAYFPVEFEKLPSHIECVSQNPVSFLRERGFKISHIAINHPGGGYGYRIVNKDRSVVYITDNELDPPYKGVTEFDEFIRFCSHADILIHDAQYIEKDMGHKRGWGHSLVSQVCKLADAADVKHLILFHHDPDRTDSELDSIQEETRSWFKENNLNIKCTVAFEGLELHI